MEPVVRVSNFSYRYPDGTLALHDMSFEVPEKSRLAILGPNGAGKSTLLLSLAGLIFGDGEIVIFGEPLTRATARRLRERIGLVFQDPDDQLFMPTVIDDAMFGPLNQGLSHEEARNRAVAALDTMGVVDLADRPPHHLSLGQKRRVAIAGVLAMRPAILALDEPAIGLDPRSRGAL
ncbi:MAG: ABC transporter ATP-binding protein, partial [Armatimonadetes bacterium]|nr:ABC transporter ATP-binding protein [Armatimonadota bacterium]